MIPLKKYVDKALLSKRVLRAGIRPTPFQKTFEINTGIQSFITDFKGANMQFSFLEISLVYDKSEQHATLYDSYNTEMAASQIASIQLENLNNKYGELNKKFGLTSKHDKYEMYRHFVAWATGGGSSVGSLTEYSDNEVYKELIKYRDYYNKSKSDERLYVDIRRRKGYTSVLEKIFRNDSNLTLTVTLKEAATKKMRLRVVGYYQGKCMYSMSNLGLLLTSKDYGIVEQNEVIALAT